MNKTKSTKNINRFFFFYSLTNLSLYLQTFIRSHHDHTERKKKEFIVHLQSHIQEQEKKRKYY